MNLTSASPQKEKRRLPSWIDQFVASTSHLPSPEIFRRWTAYSTVAAALERKVYTLIRGRRLRANMFVLLVGPPGVGKTTAIVAAKQIMVNIPSISMSPAIVTKEKLFEVIKATLKHTIHSDGSSEPHSSCNVFLNEFAVLMASKDYEFMKRLTDWYDGEESGYTYTMATRYKGEEKIEGLHLNMLGGITPRTLGEMLGDRALGMGFTARLLLVYSEELVHTPLFASGPGLDIKDLWHDLEMIHQLKGRFAVAEEAQIFIQDWVTRGMPPIPVDPRFAEYIPRRATHALKLAMLISASRSQDMIITEADMREAKRRLLEMEALMPKAIESLGQNPLSDVVKTVHHWMAVEYKIKQKPIPESAIRRELIRDVPFQYHNAVVDGLINARLCVTVGPNTAPNRMLVPVE